MLDKVLGPYSGRRRKYIFCVSIKSVFRSPILTPNLRQLECVSILVFRSTGVSKFGIQVEYLRQFRIQVKNRKLRRKCHVRSMTNKYFYFLSTWTLSTTANKTYWRVIVRLYIFIYVIYIYRLIWMLILVCFYMNWMYIFFVCFTNRDISAD